jgi:hypothetical protein
MCTATITIYIYIYIYTHTQTHTPSFYNEGFVTTFTPPKFGTNACESTTDQTRSVGCEAVDISHNAIFTAKFTQEGPVEKSESTKDQSRPVEYETVDNQTTTQ